MSNEVRSITSLTSDHKFASQPTCTIQGSCRGDEWTIASLFPMHHEFHSRHECARYTQLVAAPAFSAAVDRSPCASVSHRYRTSKYSCSLLALAQRRMHLSISCCHVLYIQSQTILAFFMRPSAYSSPHASFLGPPYTSPLHILLSITLILYSRFSSNISAVTTWLITSELKCKGPLTHAIRLKCR